MKLRILMTIVMLGPAVWALVRMKQEQAKSLEKKPDAKVVNLYSEDIPLGI